MSSGSPPDTPQYHGVAEQALGLLRENALMEDLKEGTTYRLWAETMSLACEMGNMSWSTSNEGNTTPREQSYGTAPSLDQLQPFGTVRYMRTPARTHELAPLGEKCAMVGIARNHPSGTGKTCHGTPRARKPEGAKTSIWSRGDEGYYDREGTSPRSGRTTGAECRTAGTTAGGGGRRAAGEAVATGGKVCRCSATTSKIFYRSSTRIMAYLLLSRLGTCMSPARFTKKHSVRFDGTVVRLLRLSVAVSFRLGTSHTGPPLTGQIGACRLCSSPRDLLARMS